MLDNNQPSQLRIQLCLDKIYTSCPVGAIDDLFSALIFPFCECVQLTLYGCHLSSDYTVQSSEQEQVMNLVDKDIKICALTRARCAGNNQICSSAHDCCYSHHGCFGKSNTRKCLKCAKRNKNCQTYKDCCGKTMTCQSKKCKVCKKSRQACRSKTDCCSNKCYKGKVKLAKYSNAQCRSKNNCHKLCFSSLTD